MNLEQKKVLSFKEGCDYLGYSKSYIYKMTAKGILPFSKPSGKKIFFDREKLEAWMLSNSSKSYEERQIEATTHEEIKTGKSVGKVIKEKKDLEKKIEKLFDEFFSSNEIKSFKITGRTKTENPSRGYTRVMSFKPDIEIEFN